MNCYARPSKAVLRRPVESGQYTSVDSGKRYKEMGVRPSMGSVGDAYDNAMAESFFAGLECELIDWRSWTSFDEARIAVFTWIEDWGTTRAAGTAASARNPPSTSKRNCTTKPPPPCPAPLS